MFNTVDVYKRQILYILGEFIVQVISGNKGENIMNIYYILILTIITTPFGPLFTQVLIIQKKNKEFNKIVRNTFLFNALIAPLSIYIYKGIGLAIAVVLTQFFVISYCLIYIINSRKSEV